MIDELIRTKIIKSKKKKWFANVRIFENLLLFFSILGFKQTVKYKKDKFRSRSKNDSCKCLKPT